MADVKKRTGAVKVGKKSNRALKLPPPDHSDDVIRLRRIRGQLDGVEKMIVDRRYCPDIMIQLRSVAAAVKSVEGLILSRHLKHCVTDAIQSNDAKEMDAKIREIVLLFQR